jgi:hypothetical protein
LPCQQAVLRVNEDGEARKKGRAHVEEGLTLGDAVVEIELHQRA